MAYTNLHKNLPDREIHPPKKFNTASLSSVLTKGLAKEVEWVGGSYTVQTVITCSADVSGITGGRYFILPLKNITYQVWFDVDNGDSCLINSRHTGLEIDISANDTASTIASALKTELNAISGVTATNASEKVTIEIDANTVSVSASQDGPTGSNTGYKFVTSRTSVGDEYLTTDGHGQIQWEAKPAVVTNTNYGYADWYASFANKSSSGNNDWHIISYRDTGGTAVHTYNLGTSVPASLDPLDALNACVFFAPRNLTISKFLTIIHGTAASGETVDIEFHKCTTASGTSNWTLSKICDTTVAVDNTEVDIIMETGTTMATGEIIIPFIKINTTTSGVLTYFTTLEFNFT